MVVPNFEQQVFQVHAQKRNFNWKMPHQPLNNDNRVTGTAFYLRNGNETHLVTCFHVVENAFRVTLISPSIGSLEFPCRVVWICPERDLAVLALEENDHVVKIRPPARCFEPWKPSGHGGGGGGGRFVLAAPPLGSETITVGYPLGQTHIKMTKGILSGQQVGLYQTDAPINPGNSGGPLLYKDKVIGVNARGYMLAQNVGYAVPISAVLGMMEYHQKHPTETILRIPMGWGISYHPPSRLLSLTPSNKSIRRCRIGDYATCGVEIKEVYPDQPMIALGLQKGDLLLSINGMPISALGEIPLTWLRQKMTLHNYLYQINLGDELEFTFLSTTDKKIRRASLRLPSESPRIRFRNVYSEYETIPYLYAAGLVLLPLTRDFIEDKLSFLRFPNTYREENPLTATTVHPDDPYLLQRSKPECWNQGFLVIVNLMSGSILEETKMLKIGQMIDKINHQSVSTISRAKSILQNLLREGKDIHLSTLCKVPIVLSTHHFIQEEQKLAKIYNYQSCFDLGPSKQRL